MYTLIKRLTVRELLVFQAPTVAMSLVIAEMFYKFGSFSLGLPLRAFPCLGFAFYHCLLRQSLVRRLPNARLSGYSLPRRPGHASATPREPRASATLLVH